MRRSWLRSFWAGLVVVGAVVAYLAWSGLGERLLHDEIEIQLSRLLQGPVEIDEVRVHFEGGLRLEARELEAFPSPNRAIPAAVRARRLVARIDPLALLIGRLELSTLVLEGPSLRVEQEADGSFRTLPLPPIALDPIDRDEGTLSESVLAQIEGLDAMANVFFESIRAADRIEILDGTIHWLRHAEGGAAADRALEPTEVRLELFSSIIQRDWLSDDETLEWSAVVVDGQHAPYPIGAVVDRAADASHFNWIVTLSQIPLAAAESPLGFAERIDGLSGQLTTAIHLGTTAEGARRLRIDGSIHDAIIGLRRSKTRIHRERATLHAEIEISEKRVRLIDAHLEGDRIGLDFKGSLTRPIRPTSTARLESRVVGIELDSLFELAHSLEGESEAALAFSRWVERVEGGRILYVEAAGTASLAEWQDMTSGRMTDLPDGFVLGGAFEEVVVAAGPQDRISDLRGEVEWVGERITLRNTGGRFRGEPLPTLDVVLEGADHLARAPRAERDVKTNPPPIPGLAALLQLVEPKDPRSQPPVKAIGLAIDRLEHPVFRYPLRDLRVLVEPLRGGLDVHVRSGIWGGATVAGEVNWSNTDETPSIKAQLQLGTLEKKPADSTRSADGSPGDEPDASLASDAPPRPDANGGAAETASGGADTTSLGDAPPGESRVADAAGSPGIVAAAAQGAVPTRSDDRWGKGRFELEFRPTPRLPFRKATGFFRLDGTRLVANEVQFEVEPVGQLAARIVLDMLTEGELGTDLSFAATDTRLEHVSEFIALPPDLATGELDATGSLRGPIQPDAPLIGRLDGSIRITAKTGKIRTKVPLLLRLSRASEGYNPFADEDELRYETVAANIAFRQGSLSSDDFEIEGPLRIYARGRIDPLAEPSQARGVVGIFLFRAPNQILETLPLVKFFLPGSERGLVGAYFDVKGALAEPKVEPLPVDTLMTLVPSAIKAPFKVLQYLFDPADGDS